MGKYDSFTFARCTEAECIRRLDAIGIRGLMRNAVRHNADCRVVRAGATEQGLADLLRDLRTDLGGYVVTSGPGDAITVAFVFPSPDDV